MISSGWRRPGFSAMILDVSRPLTVKDSSTDVRRFAHIIDDKRLAALQIVVTVYCPFADPAGKGVDNKFGIVMILILPLR
jgi:hypothetical protein